MFFNRSIVLVQTLGAALMLWALANLGAAFLGWAQPMFVTLHLFGLTIDVVSWVMLSVGYHLFCLHAFGRWGLLVLSWLSAALLLVALGVAMLQAPGVSFNAQWPLGPMVVNVPVGVWLFTFVFLALVAALNVFLFHPTTVALFQPKTPTSKAV